MRGKDERGRSGAPHRAFDRRDRVHAVVVEIAENAHETGAQLAAGLLKGRPVDQRILFVHRIIIPRAAPRSPSGADLPALTEVGKRAVDEIAVSRRTGFWARAASAARQSVVSGKSVSVRVDPGGARTM